MANIWDRCMWMSRATELSYDTLHLEVNDVDEVALFSECLCECKQAQTTVFFRAVPRLSVRCMAILHSSSLGRASLCAPPLPPSLLRPSAPPPPLPSLATLGFSPHVLCLMGVR